TVLDIDAMRAAAALCLGDHDFRAFQAANDYRTQTWRRLDAFDIAVMPHPHAPIVHLRVTGNAFLKNMVRILVGTLVEVGLGRRRASDMRRLLSGQASRRDAGPTAPAPGLTLEHVELATT
ncbi:MAG: tRNA pseudouridine(38-40) synthase TruA, partial [Polyangiales bacterium]